MFDYVDKIHDGTLTTYNGKKFDTVVAVGIGGSDLGPVMIYQSFRGVPQHLKFTLFLM
jgi:glucose-6-phosphate isomerase